MKIKLINCTILIFISGLCFSQTDIELTYSTFLGGGESDGSSGLVFTDQNEDYYLVYGNSASQDIVVTSDAYQSSMSDLVGGYFAVFSTLGELEYASYLNGNDYDLITSAAIDPNNRTILAGVTTSSDFPLLDAANETIGPEQTGFLTCFDENFNLVWSTYFGGNALDGVNAIVVDSEGAIYITGVTESPGLGTPGVHSEVQNSEASLNGFISKVSSGGELIWYSYISGSGFTGTNDLAISADESTVYVTGFTFDADDHGFINSFQSQPGGGGECFLAAYSTEDGTMDWGTYYGGEENDTRCFVGALSNGNVAISGSTRSQTGIVTANAYQEQLSGMGDHFIASFDENGERLWGTYFGGAEDEGFMADICVLDNEIYFIGQTMSNSGISFGNPLMDEIPLADNYSDSYIARFNEFGTPIWASFLHENHECASSGSLIINQEREIFVAGGFNPLSNANACLEHISPNAFQSFYGGGDSDIGLLHFQDNILSTTFPQAEPLTIYPNPAQNHVTIEAPNLLWAGMELIVTDISGRTVDRVSRFQSGSAYSTAHLSEGVYILTGQIGERMFREKLVVQR